MIYGLDKDTQRLFEELSDRGWVFTLKPLKNHKAVWCEILGRIKIKQITDFTEDESEDATHAEEKDYCSDGTITDEIPFAIQFEGYLQRVDKAYHEFVVPHLSGRIDEDEFEDEDDDEFEDEVEDSEK